MNIPPQERERYEFLCREIERLIERHKAMPTDELKSRVSAEITACLHELDKMEEARRNQNVYEESYRYEKPYVGFQGAYPAIGAGVLCVLIGAVFGVSLLILGGLLVLLVAAGSLTRGHSPRQRTENHQWEWKP